MSKYAPGFGIMQGRLLPKYQNRYQAHPVGSWSEEFPIAQELGLVSIEFILDYNDAEKNPLLSDNGIVEIRNMVQQTGVAVNTVCADYFMEAPLHHADADIRKKSLDVLKVLMENGRQIGLKDIVLPCVDQSSLQDAAAKDRLVETLTPVLELAEKANINLSLETDLAPKPFKDLIDRFDSKKITVNYDTGNSASLGYNPLEEFSLYGNRVSDIHIKDRTLGGGSVFLGTGDARFTDFFTAFSTLEFNMPLIFQVYRDDEGIEVFKKQLSYFQKIYTDFFQS